jgi:hypothetical protein
MLNKPGSVLSKLPFLEQKSGVAGLFFLLLKPFASPFVASIHHKPDQRKTKGLSKIKTEAGTVLLFYFCQFNVVTAEALHFLLEIVDLKLQIIPNLLQMMVS